MSKAAAAKTIFMIHGMWGSGPIWDNYKTFFEQQGYQVVVPTLRFHEEEYHRVPPVELGSVSLLDYAADLEKQIRALKEKPIIMGHSMGGLLAQILASRGLAESLVLLTPAPPAGVLALRPSSTRTFLSVLTDWKFWDKPMRITFNEAKYGILNVMAPAEQRAAYDSYAFESGRAAFEIAFWPLDTKKAAKVKAADIKCPVLVVSGEKDRIVPKSVVEQVAKRYKQATYKEFKGQAHSVLNQPGWQDVAGYVNTWLKAA